MKRTCIASVLALAVVAGVSGTAQAGGGNCGFCINISWKSWYSRTPGCCTPDFGCPSGGCPGGAPADAHAYNPAFVPAYGHGGAPAMAYNYNYPAYGAAPAFAGVSQAHYQAALAQAMQAIYGGQNAGGYDRAAVAFGGR